MDPQGNNFQQQQHSLPYSSHPMFNPNALYFVPSSSPQNNPGLSWNTSPGGSLQSINLQAGSTCNDENNSDGVRWRDDETRILLSLWRNHFSELKNKRNTAKIWAEIAKELNRKLEKSGETLFRKGEQCKRRVKNLEKEYKVVMDSKGRSGNGDKEFEEGFEYFDIFNELLGSNHDIIPQNIVEGRRPDQSSSSTSPEPTESSTDEDKKDGEEIGQVTPNTSKGKEPAARGGKRKKKNDADDSESLLDFLKDSQKRDEEFFGRLAQREQEFQMKLAEMEMKREREREEKQQTTMLSLFKEIAKAMKD